MMLTRRTLFKAGAAGALAGGVFAPFVARAQSLGFSLDEVGSLLDLEDGRNRRAIQTVTQRRLEQIDEKVGDLERMRGALRDMLARCEETGQASPCPIIAALVGPPADPQPPINRLR
mgnify:CR=1 FL=1